MPKAVFHTLIDESISAMSTLTHGTEPSTVLSDHVPHSAIPWRALAPIATTGVLALIPAPEGLPQVAEKLAREAMEPEVSSSPQDFAAFVHKDHAMYESIVKVSGAKVE